MSYPHQPPPQPYCPPPPAPQRKRSALGWIIGGIATAVLLCCGGGIAVVALSGGDNPAGDKPAAAIGEPARDGDLEFEVTSTDCGATTVGKAPFDHKAQGVWCKVSLTVRNIGSEPATFAGGSQKAFGPDGAEYSNDAGAELFAEGDSNSLLKEINPGNTVSGFLLFDVPPGTRLNKLELHDSPLSDGVTVQL